MKNVAVTDYINQTSPSISNGKNVYVQNPSKMRKYLTNVHNIEGAHLQCVNNHYSKYE